ncbi:FHA domain-containing protein [Massilia luteola]|uniref:FHA domain-containing protein n=1 Tax=Massilia luteola TaxID=3081751 RepID=UPI002ACC2A49|nr:FHA domain-containing protein [Massilia sp. Gc5]
MKRCSSPDHPHCTVWVAPGEPVCAHGHRQAPGAVDLLGSSFDLLQRVRTDGAPARMPEAIRPAPRPHLHVSGFDPRAAGGRQAIKLELRGMPDDVPPQLTLLLESQLLPDDGGRQQFNRTLRGDWRPVFVEFSSRGREHGQYRIDLELHARDPARPATARTWVATLVLLVPRPDASLGEIHQTFLSTHKNVRISADDAGIARVHGLAGGGAMDIDIQARNASIAQLTLDANAGGKVAVALPTIAWDEDLIEIDLPAERAAHPCPASTACLVYAEPDAGAHRHVRLFALDECVLGRHEPGDADCDLLLEHYGERGPDREGLTRRLSARHAVIRPARGGFEIEDVSRYGLLLDGAWPGKHAPMPLRLGMRIELTASIRGVVTFVVTALHAHALTLHRVDAGGAAECFMLFAPGVEPQPNSGTALPRAAGMPILFHRDGGFWHRDPATGQETALGPATVLERLARFTGRVRFACRARPEDQAGREDEPRQAGDRRRAAARLLDA